MWAVDKGSLVNVAMLVPAALAVSALAPWVVTPLLTLGGGYPCFDGVEKLAHGQLQDAEEERAEHDERLQAVANPDADLAAREKEKIEGAVRTDFVLSAEIVTISLGTVTDAPFATRLMVLVGMGLHESIHHQAARLEGVPAGAFAFSAAADAIVGVVAGALILIAALAIKRARPAWASRLRCTSRVGAARPARDVRASTRATSRNLGCVEAIRRHSRPRSRPRWLLTRDVSRLTLGWAGCLAEVARGQRQHLSARERAVAVATNI